MVTKIISGSLFYFFVFFLIACGNANVTITGLKKIVSTPPMPSFNIETTSGALSGGSLMLKARVTSVGSPELTGGGVTLSQGVVK